MVAAGVSPEFSARAMQTPASSMWYPTEQELLEAGVVTSVTEGLDFALSAGGPPPTLDLVRSMLAEQRVYRVLQSADPVAYAHIMHAVHDGLARGESLNALRLVIAPTLHAAFLDVIPRVSEEAILRLGDVQIDQLKQLQSAPGELCLGFIRSGTLEAYHYISAETRQQELDSIADALESVTQPSASVTPAFPAAQERETARDGGPVRSQGRGQGHGRARDLASPSVEPKASMSRRRSACTSGMAALPRTQRALLIRASLTDRTLH